MRKFLALLFALLLCTATKVYAEDAATVTVAVKDLPQKLQNRTVIVTLGNGPSDTESTVIVLDGLNNYTATVTVAPSEYYCAAAVQYDALGDYPLQEINQTTFLPAEGGNHYDLIYTLVGSSWYESVTGQQRHYTLQPLETPPENYEPKPAQVGAYLTAPVGFSQHVIVYLQNLYTDDVYDLELYESNVLAAVEPNALSGKYAFLSAYSLEPGAAMGGREENPDSALQSFVTGINPPNCGGRNGVFSSHLPPLFLFCSHT